MIKLIKRAASYIKSVVRNIFADDYKIKMVSDDPETCKKKTVYIVQDGSEPETLIFACPCGCRAVIKLNLLPDAKPCWIYLINDKNKITVTPSIWRKSGCKSHFFLRKSRIVWA